MPSSRSAQQTEPVSASVAFTDLARWREFLTAQEGLCVEHGFGAAMVTIGIDDDGQRQQAIEVVAATARPTDRTGVLCDTELAVLLMPLTSIHEARRLATDLDVALRRAGVSAHLGWAMRLADHDLFHAAARADAAMLSARRHAADAATSRVREAGPAEESG
jgi:hypothetical protein